MDGVDNSASASVSYSLKFHTKGQSSHAVKTRGGLVEKKQRRSQEQLHCYAQSFSFTTCRVLRLHIEKVYQKFLGSLGYRQLYLENWSNPFERGLQWFSPLFLPQKRLEAGAIFLCTWTVRQSEWKHLHHCLTNCQVRIELIVLHHITRYLFQLAFVVVVSVQFLFAILFHHSVKTVG